nr:FAD-dependent oxidoreductase [Clostridia bacterium]
IRYGYDTVPPAWRNGDPGPGEQARYVTRFSAQIFALALTEWMVKEGVVLLLDSVVSSPVMDGTRCQGLIVENKSGREYYQAGMVVDVTGDADVLFRAGVPTMQGLNFFTYVAYGITLESCRRAVESGKIHQAYVGFHGGKATLYGDHHPATRRRYEGTDSRDVTAYVVDNQLELLESIRSGERFSREITTLPGMAQFRTTRCIEGEHMLREADKYRHFEDSVGAICDFDNRGFLYEVPYGCLVRKGFDNLLTAGRSASATGYAWDVLRVIPPAILTGQAAGEAAALALQTGKPIWDVEIGALQKRLAKTGVILHFEDEWIPEGDAAVPASEDIGHI